VTGSVIDARQVVYAVAGDLYRVIPGVDVITGAVIVAESLEADALLNSSVQALITSIAPDLGATACAFTGALRSTSPCSIAKCNEPCWY
jgi:hypothetical protein